MFDIIKNTFLKHGIDRIGIIPITECEVINSRILPDNIKSAVMFCIPYRSVLNVGTDGFSEYARIYDYHKFSNTLYDEIIPELQKKTKANFYGFCDHSPINEKTAIAKCGMGVIGRNSLYIDGKYGSFIFIGSLLTDIETDFIPKEIKGCIDCGKCVSTCPGKAIVDFGIDRYRCLSAISQKKKKTDEEKEILRKNNIAWGCDICQNVCPYNEKAAISPIKYFSETRISCIDIDFITSLSDDEFEKYAFAYKGKKVVIENIENIT